MTNNQKALAFAFDERAVRVLPSSNGSFSVVAKDVADVLGYQWNGAQRIAHVPDDWKGVTSVVTPSGMQEVLTLTEEGLYFFLARSDKPRALPFQKWMAGEVLPAIRKSGFYGRGPSISQQLSAHNTRLKLLDKMELERHPEKRLAIHQQLDHVSRILGLPTPALEAIGYAVAPEPVPSLVLDFWEMVEFIGLDKLNHSRDAQLIAINLNHFVRLATEHRLKAPSTLDLRRVLARSVEPKFMEPNKTVNSRIEQRAVKCWMFASGQP